MSAINISDDWQSGKTVVQSTCYMFDNAIATDVTFKFPNSDETVKAHRLLLMARSHVFFAMFNSSLDKPGKDIELPDIEPAVFRDFLRYLYCDEVTLSLDKALLLTYCAEKYQVKTLRVECMRLLLKDVKNTTVAMILDHAILYDDAEVMKKCLDFIRSTRSLKPLEEHHITRETLGVVLATEGLPVGDIDIFRFCNAWAENECKKMEVAVNTSNKRKMLGALQTQIPIHSMTHMEFAAEVSGRDFLTPEEELEMFRLLCTPDVSNLPVQYRPNKAPLICVKLPRSGVSVSPPFFHSSMSCSHDITVLGVHFTKTGDFRLQVGTSQEDFIVQEENLDKFLKTPILLNKGRELKISTLIRGGPGRLPYTQRFSHCVSMTDLDNRPTEIAFTLTTYALKPEDPLFDRLILWI